MRMGIVVGEWEGMGIENH